MVCTDIQLCTYSHEAVLTDLSNLTGMGNRFSTLPQYHTLIKAHGILGAIVFLFIVPAAVFYARFYTRRPGYAIRYHAYLQILAVLLTIVLFTLGWFAVGPERSLTNPHHAIGVTILTLILVQIFGGWIIKNIKGRSLRVKLHQWFGRTIALLGIAQVPLGLALYGSPRYLFILYALWMAFLLFLYFIFDYRAWDRPDYEIRDRDGRSEVTRTERTDRKSSGGARWLGPAAAAGGLWALMRGRKKERSPSRERSRSRSRASRVRSRSRGPEVIPSRRESYIERRESHIDEEKHADRYSERPQKSSGGGFMDRFLGLGAGLGAGALIGRMAGRNNRKADEEYSAVDTDTPNRRRLSRSSRRHGGTVITEYSDESEEYRRDGRRSPLLPGPGGPSAMAAAISAAERRPSVSRPARPSTPQRSHHRGDSRIESTVDSDYSSYVSPSRRGSESRHDKGAVEKGLLAGLGLGWFAKKMKDRRGSKNEGRVNEEEQRLRFEEEERRAGQHQPRYTGDGYSQNTPPRRHSRRQSLRPAAPIRVATEASHLTEEESSLIETRPLSGYDAPGLSGQNYQQYQPPPPGPVSPPAAQYTAHTPMAPPPPPSIPVPVDNASYARTESRHSFVEPAVMPVIPDDPRGILARESETDSYGSHRDRRSESRRRAGEAAMAAAASSAGMLAAEQEAQRRVEEERGAARGRTPPVSVKVKVHDDKDRNVTLRRLTEEEAMAARRARRRRADSVSSMSGSEVASGSRSRYRRDASRRRAEEVGEGRVEPLSPPQPAFAGGKKPKDSAYYSGPPPIPGPSGTQPGAGATVSSLASPGSHGTWSGMSPVGTPGVPGPSEAASATASAADRRRRRRQERRNDRPAATGTVDFT